MVHILTFLRPLHRRGGLSFFNPRSILSMMPAQRGQVDAAKPTVSLETAGFVLGRGSSAGASPISRGFAADDSPTAQLHFLRTETGPFQFIVKRLTDLMGEAELRDREGDGGWPARLEGRDLRRGRGARRAASDLGIDRRHG